MSKIVLSGDVMYDAALFYQKKAKEKSGILKKLDLGDFVLVTLHRAENVDNVERLSSIVSALNEVSSQMRVVLPLHPRTKKKLEETGLKFSFDTIEPVGYLDMIQLLNNCKLVMTDSGGLQKEAFFFKKHCIVLRNETEWTELVKEGLNVCTGINKERILSAFALMLKTNSDFNFDFYGKGNAGAIIVDTLRSIV